MNANAECIHSRARTIARVFVNSVHKIVGSKAVPAPGVGETPWDLLPADEKKLLEDTFVDVLQHLPPEAPLSFAGGMGQD